MAGLTVTVVFGTLDTKASPAAQSALDAGHRAAGLIPAMAEEDAPRSASPRSVVA
jgi:hypothetical protein